MPRKNGELVFEAPWEGRAFGLVVALHENQCYAWDDFKDQLIAEIARAEEAGEGSSYYERWLAAFERLLAERGLLAPEEVASRAAALATAAPDHD